MAGERGLAGRSRDLHSLSLPQLVPAACIALLQAVFGVTVGALLTLAHTISRIGAFDNFLLVCGNRSVIGWEFVLAHT